MEDGVERKSLWLAMQCCQRRFFWAQPYSVYLKEKKDDGNMRGKKQFGMLYMQTWNDVSCFTSNLFAFCHTHRGREERVVDVAVDYFLSLPSSLWLCWMDERMYVCLCYLNDHMQNHGQVIIRRHVKKCEERTGSAHMKRRRKKTETSVYIFRFSVFLPAENRKIIYDLFTCIQKCYTDFPVYLFTRVVCSLLFRFFLYVKAEKHFSFCFIFLDQIATNKQKLCIERAAAKTFSYTHICQTLVTTTTTTTRDSFYARFFLYYLHL